MRDRFVIDTAFKVVEQQQGCLHAVSSFMCAFVVNTDKPVYLTDGPTGASTCLGAEVPIPCCVVAMLYVTVRQTWPAKRGEGGGLSLLGWLLGGSRLGMETFFSSADLALSEGGLSLLGWLLGGLEAEYWNFIWPG